MPAPPERPVNLLPLCGLEGGGQAASGPGGGGSRTAVRAAGGRLKSLSAVDPARRRRRSTAMANGFRPYMPQAWKALHGLGEEDRGTVAVTDVGRADAGEQDGATGIDQEMAFDAADLLAAAVAVQTTALRAPGTLAVHDGSTGSRIRAALHPFALAQGCRHPLPHALFPPLPPGVTDRLPRRQVMRQESPGAAGTEPVRQRVEDLPPSVLRRSPTRLDLWNQRPDDLPLRIRQIRRATGTQAAHPSPRTCVTTPLPGTCPLTGFQTPSSRRAGSGVRASAG